MVRADLPDILKQFRTGLEEIYSDRLVKVILYGSQARGDARPDSDVDVLVVLRAPETPEDREQVLDLVTNLSLEREVLVSRGCVSEGFFLTRQGPFLRNVRKEGIPV